MNPLQTNPSTDATKVAQEPLVEAASLEAPETPEVAPAQTGQTPAIPPKKPGAFLLLKKIFGNKFLRFGLVTVVIITVILLLLSMWWSKRHNVGPNDQAVNDQFSTTTVPLNVGSDGSAEINQKKVSVNGNVKILGAYTLVPSERPNNPVPGQQYIDNKDFRLYVFNGSEWISQLNVADLNSLNVSIANNLQAANAQITNLQAQTATIGNVATQAAETPPFTLPGETTLQGNTFNGASQLVQLTGGGLLPALDASNLLNLNASNISSGTLSDARLSTNVTLQGNTFNGASQLVQLTGGGLLPALDASNLLNLNASNITTGTLADGRLSANVALLDRAGQIFTGDGQIFKGSSSSAFQLQNSLGSAYFFGDSSGSTIGVGALGADVKLNIETSDNIALRANQTGSDDLVQLASGGTNVITISSTGASLFKNTANSTSAFSVQTSGGGTALNVDTTNSRVSVNKSSAAYPLEVGGSVGIDNTGDASGIGLYIGGTQVCNVAGCISASGGGGGINNSTTLQLSANFAIQGTVLDTTNPTARIRQYNGQTTSLLQVENSSGGKIASVNSNGITLGAKPDSTDSSFTKITPFVQQGIPYVAEGSYLGDGTNNRIVPLSGGFGTPKLVMITEGTVGNNPVSPPLLRIDGMQSGTCNASNPNNCLARGFNDGSTSTTANSISAFEIDQFRVGVSTAGIASSNTLNKTYHYLAVSAASNAVTSGNSTADNYMAYGTYSGNGIAGRNISFTPPSGSWTPDMVIVSRYSGGGSTGAYPVFTTSSMPASHTVPFTAANFGVYGNAITALGSNGFTLGSDSYVNQNGISYAWFAIKKAPNLFDTNTYGGTGTTATHNFASGYTAQPDWVTTKVDNWNNPPASGSPQSYTNIKSSSMSGNRSYSSLNGEKTTAITALNQGIPSSFTVGSEATANAMDGAPPGTTYCGTTCTYYWFGFSKNLPNFNDDFIGGGQPTRANCMLLLAMKMVV